MMVRCKDYNSLVHAYLNQVDRQEVVFQIQESVIPIFLSHANVNLKRCLLIDRLSHITIRDKGVWSMLPFYLQQLFQALTPYQLPPNVHEYMYLYYGVKFNVLHGFQTYQLNDRSFYRMQFLYECRGSLIFSLADHKKLNLSVTGPQNKALPEKLPKGLKDFFEIDVIQKIINDDNYSYLAKSMILQYQHQVRVMIEVYHNMLLESLGSKADRPIAVATGGEWRIDPKGTVQSLKDALHEDSSPKRISLFADQIANLLNLEQQTGLFIIGQKEKFYVRGKCLFSESPVFTFIDEDMEKRHKRILSRLEQWDENLAYKVENYLKKKNNDEKKIVSLLIDAVRNNLLFIEDLLDKTIPAQIYLRYVQAVVGESVRQKVGMESIYHLCLSQLLNIPGKGKPNALICGNFYKLVVAQDQENLQDLTKLIQKYLMKSFDRQPFEIAFDKIRRYVNKRLDKDETIADFPLDGFNCASECFEIYFQLIYENISQFLMKELTISDTILLYRAAFHAGANKECVEDLLENALHQHLIAYESNRIHKRVDSVICALFESRI